MKDRKKNEITKNLRHPNFVSTVLKNRKKRKLSRNCNIYKLTLMNQFFLIVYF